MDKDEARLAELVGITGGQVVADGEDITDEVVARAIYREDFDDEERRVARTLHLAGYTFAVAVRLTVGAREDVEAEDAMRAMRDDIARRVNEHSLIHGGA